jgi:hypothetical protein
MMPAITQQTKTRSGDKSSADMGATFLYTPDPMTELTVNMKAENKLSD